MLNITPDTRILTLNRVIRVFNGRSPGEVIHYGQQAQHHELIFKWSGNSVSRIGDAEYALSAGSILYLPQGRCGEYSVKTLDQGEAIDIFMELNAPLSDVPVLLPAPHRPAVQEWFAACHEAWRMGSETRMLSCIGYAYNILAELKSETMRRKLTSTGVNAFVQTLEYLSEHCFDPHLDLKRLGESSGVSYSYMKRLFIDQLGMPPSRYVTMRRMELAKDLLQATEDSVTEISKAVGYASVYYFSRVFRQEMRMTPSEYRSSMR